MMGCDGHEVNKLSGTFCNPVRIVFGAGSLSCLSKLTWGRRAILLTTAGFTRRGVTERIIELTGKAVVEIIDDVEPNPDIEALEQTSQRLHGICPDVIVAVGGGSVIDTAKVMNAMLATEGAVLSLRAHFDNNQGELNGVGIPVIAVPTTAGTGSEVTPFATVWDQRKRMKYSLAGPQLFPEVALMDPCMTISLSRDMTIMSGLDAVSHALESVWNYNATHMTIMYATEALRLAIPTLGAVVSDLDDLKLRARMLLASTYAGLAISNTRTALAHSISYPLTMHCGVPHGLACSFTLPAILRFNLEVDDGRMHDLALALGLRSAEALYLRIRRFLDELGVDKMLMEYVPNVEELLNLTQEMLTPERASNNLRSAKHSDLTAILKDSYRWVTNTIHIVSH